MRALVVVCLAACGSSAQGPADAYTILDAPAHAGAGPGGGILDDLRFAVVGDTRPANVDDTANYPTSIVQGIWTAVEAESPHPQFAVTTGDYMFATPGGSAVDAQLDLYLGARAAYSGITYPKMGNHECTGDTLSNCGPGGQNGDTSNYTEYLARLVEPVGETHAWYAERFAASDGSWTAKFVFVAPNAWNTQQEHWLGLVLAEPTTYTFVVRHETHLNTNLPAVVTSAQLMTQYPLTMLITGHVHEYEHVPDYREIVVGTGGAPLTSSIDYGYVILARQPDGTIDVSVYSYQTHTMIDHFVVNADGSPH